MRRLFLTLILLSLPASVFAQVVNPGSVTFISTDHATTIPAGQLGAGQPTLASYQASIFAASADVSTGVPIAVGPVIAKTGAVLQPAPAPASTYKLTFAQMGIVTPACTVLPCPTYTLVLVAIGPGGISARGVASESDPFSAAVPTQPLPPAAPGSVKVGP